MRRIAVGALALGILLLAASAGSGSTTADPKLRLTSLAPLQVNATGFRAGELVGVRVLAPKPATKRVSAGSAGAFVARFSDVTVDRCSDVAIVAVGARGSRASLKRPAPECPPRL